jgi:hypothetical protein
MSFFYNYVYKRLFAILSMKVWLDQFTIVETQPFSELHTIVCDLFMLL